MTFPSNKQQVVYLTKAIERSKLQLARAEAARDVARVDQLDLYIRRMSQLRRSVARRGRRTT